jgi:hypothetical protein
MEWSQPIAAIPGHCHQRTDVPCFEQPKPGERCSRFGGMSLQIERETGFEGNEADRVQAQIAREPLYVGQHGTNRRGRVRDDDSCRVHEFQPLAGRELDDGLDTLAHVSKLSRDR